MWKRWYHVLVEAPDGRRHRLAIAALSAWEALQLAEADWGEGSVREVTSPR